MRTARSTVFLVTLLLTACVSVPDQPESHGPVVLYSAYISGGDAPTMDSLAVFEDGYVRYHVAGTSARWRKLNPGDMERVRDIKDQLLPWLPREPTARECCDSPELIIDLEKDPSALSSIEMKQLIIYPTKRGRSLSPELERFLEWRNSTAKSVGGRRWITVERGGA